MTTSQVCTTYSSSSSVVWMGWSPAADRWIEWNYPDLVRARRRERKADARATKLLIAHLTLAQREQYEGDGFFDVRTLRAGQPRWYRLTHGWAGNVYLLNEEGRKIECFCIHPDRPIPCADNLLAQKLLLETDEEQFLRTANRTRLAA